MFCFTSPTVDYVAARLSTPGLGGFVVCSDDAHRLHRGVQGVYGWQLSQTVQAYSSYELGQVPPEPEKSEVRRRCWRLRFQFSVFVIRIFN
eukprot:1397461-Pyramimonas_sp.AAC.1